MKGRLHWLVVYGLIRWAALLGLRKKDLLARLVVGPDAVAEDQAPFFDELQAMGRLVKGRVCYLATDHEISHEVLRCEDFHTMSFGANFPAPLRWLEERVRGGLLHTLSAPSMLAIEPPDHTRLRKTVSSVFTPRAVARLREQMERAAADSLAQLAPGTVVDVADTYCSQLPVAIISDILGVPEEDQPLVRGFGRYATPSLDIAMPWRYYRAVQEGIAGLNIWVSAHMDYLRAHPNDGLMSQLIQTNTTLSEVELTSVAGFMLSAGLETTVNLLGNGIKMLLEQPEHLATLREHPELWPTAVDEILRLEAPSQFTARIAAKDTELAGVKIKRGEFVVVYFAAANRDPAVFPDPHRFDIRRANAGRNLSFSGGRHFCLGSALARMEGEVGLRMFFERFPEARLAGPGVRREARVLRGWAKLPVDL